MSLLLDALKKAADDKKKSVDDSTDESLAQDNSRANDEDSLELELDEKQIINNELISDSDFPRVEEQPVISQTPQATTPEDNPAVTETVPESAYAPRPDASQNMHTRDTGEQTTGDTIDIEQAVELELAVAHTADTEVTDSPDESPAETPQSEALSTSTTADNASQAAASAVTRNTDQSSATEAAHTVNRGMNQTDRSHQSSDNQAALSALINKSNQYQRRAQKKRTILLVTLILLLISGSALFFYLKTEMASQELYIAQNNSSPLLRESPAASKRTQPTADNQTAPTEVANSKPLTSDHTHNTQTTSHSHSTEAAMPRPRPAQTSRPAAVNVSSKPAETKIHIQQSHREDPIEPLIMNAYNAFQRGQNEQAETLYQQVLVQEPRNRDANLGLAAIALKQQRYEVARQKYLTLLQLNPKDSLAIAGLSSINQSNLHYSGDAALSESQLKFMLKEQPDAAHLYFALGSVHAGKNQWPQAQSAYFSAWSGDSNNADYAFNLAVSLDHINQPQQALQYYQLSLGLMQNSSANFSAAQVQQRINSLQGAIR